MIDSRKEKKIAGNKTNLLFIVISFMIILGAILMKSQNAPILRQLWLITLLPVIFLKIYMVCAIFRYKKKENGDHRQSSSLNAFCSVIIAVRNEPFPRVYKSLKSIHQIIYDDKIDVILVDNDSYREFAEEYQKLSTLCTLLFAPTSPMRQFGAQLLGAQSTNSEWIAIIDADYVVKEAFLEEAMVILTKTEADAVGFSQFYEEDGKVSTRWANAMLSFEFSVENPYRYKCNAQTLSGTMIVVRRELFIEYYAELKKAPYTADFGFALWLHKHRKKIEVSDKILGAGLAPKSIYDLAIQQAKWADDLLQYIRFLVKGYLGFSPKRHWHFLFHSSKHLLSLWLIVAVITVMFVIRIEIAIAFYFITTFLQFLVFYSQGYLKKLDIWYPFLFNLVFIFAIGERLISCFNLSKRFKIPTRKVAK